MNHKQLGNSGLSLPPIMFGGNVFGWTADEPTSFRLLDHMIAAGLTAIDTADMYSSWVPGHQGGESETVIGNYLAQRGGRDKLIIATKVGMMTGADGKKLSKPTIEAAVVASLKRLRTDVIDLYQAHADEAETPLEETLTAFAGLIEQGKVRAIGASNYTAPRLRDALATSARLGLPRYESLQPHYNLLERPAYEAELEPLCVAENLGVINYFALAAGFLTGKYRNEADFAASPRGEGVKKYLDPKGRRVLAALDDIAASHRANPAQVAVAWLIARPSITAPIASATSTTQLDDLIRAATLRLTPADIATLDRASADH
ncbi:aldo/keto reductase [Acidiphilium acidophilum]|uniref:Aldo/keto reductase n=1 Tax=Acidiphilium acidophilum TaxID=76588 RepID=A0AAW9DQF0_ACIAO|nr:aldo/keto reductase [Acidiphilium acidophilum]MDX5930282.1 aldo/keto reductase [Acidiphilium acidophilum]GBQ27400.1 aldo/keto reductase [Acidiphilium acidophilum DSM 700]